jgi:hypothetical protein
MLPDLNGPVTALVGRAGPGKRALLKRAENGDGP